MVTLFTPSPTRYNQKKSGATPLIFNQLGKQEAKPLQSPSETMAHTRRHQDKPMGIEKEMKKKENSFSNVLIK